MPWATAEYTLSEAHNQLVWRATAARLPGRRAARVVTAVLLGTGLITTPWLPWLGVPLVGVGGAIALQQWWDRRQYLQRCRQAMGFETPIRVRFDDDGVEIIGARSHVVAGWDTPMEDRGPLLVVEIGTLAVHIPWAAVEPSSARAEVLSRMGPPFSRDTIRVVDSALDARTMMLLEHAATLTREGLNTLLAAALCDSELVARLRAGGVDVDALEAAVLPEDGSPDPWASPGAPADHDAMHRVIGLASRRASPPRLEHVLLELMHAPELTSLWNRVGRADPLPESPAREASDQGPRLVWLDDDETPLSYVVAELAQLGQSPLQAARTAMTIHDHGRADIGVSDPEVLAREISARAAEAGWPLTVEVRR
jgi:ATP-dependent Clp protease adapter protein ClpS